MVWKKLLREVIAVRSFRHQSDNRREVYLNLINSIESQVRQAYARRHEEQGLTQSALAEKLGVDRSVIHRRLSRQTNVTAETVADMVWGLGHCIKVDIFDPEDRPSNEFRVVPQEIPKVTEFKVRQFKSAGAVQSAPAKTWQITKSDVNDEVTV